MRRMGNPISVCVVQTEMGIRRNGCLATYAYRWSLLFAKAIETNFLAVPITLEPLVSGVYFNYDAPPACTTSGGTFTATGHSGSVIGDTLTVTVTLNGSTATKTWGGDLF
jgi:hypothetical protein